MLDIGWSEMLMIAVVAIIVIGPKDLPKALRTIGQWVNKIKGMAREFQTHVDDLVRESELDDLRKTAKGMTDLNLDSADNVQYAPTAPSNIPVSTAAANKTPQTPEVAPETPPDPSTDADISATEPSAAQSGTDAPATGGTALQQTMAPGSSVGAKQT